MSDEIEVTISMELAEFLLGSGQLNACWFSDVHPEMKGNFWWRTPLRKFIEAAISNTQTGRVAVDREDLRLTQCSARWFENGYLRPHKPKPEVIAALDRIEALLSSDKGDGDGS